MLCRPAILCEGVHTLRLSYFLVFFRSMVEPRLFSIWHRRKRRRCFKVVVVALVVVGCCVFVLEEFVGVISCFLSRIWDGRMVWYIFGRGETLTLTIDHQSSLYRDACLG